MGKSFEEEPDVDDKIEASPCTEAGVPKHADEAASPVGEKKSAQSGVDTLARDFLSALDSLSFSLNTTGKADASTGAASGPHGIGGEASSGLPLEAADVRKDAEDFAAKVDAELSRTLGELEMEEQLSAAGSRTGQAPTAMSAKIPLQSQRAPSPASPDCSSPVAEPGKTKERRDAGNAETGQPQELFQTLISFATRQERMRRRRRAVVGIAAAVLAGILVLLLSGLLPTGGSGQGEAGVGLRSTVQAQAGTPAQEEGLAEVPMTGASGPTKGSSESRVPQAPSEPAQGSQVGPPKAQSPSVRNPSSGSEASGRAKPPAAGGVPQTTIRNQMQTGPSTSPSYREPSSASGASTSPGHKIPSLPTMQPGNIQAPVIPQPPVRQPAVDNPPAGNPDVPPVLQNQAAAPPEAAKVSGLQSDAGTPKPAPSPPYPALGSTTNAGDAAGPLKPVMTPAVAISRVIPVYPLLAAKLSVTGTVVVVGLIDGRGIVTKATAVSGPQLLRAAAEEALMKWRFKPAARDGVSVSSEVTISFLFKGQ